MGQQSSPAVGSVESSGSQATSSPSINIPFLPKDTAGTGGLVSLQEGAVVTGEIKHSHGLDLAHASQVQHRGSVPSVSASLETEEFPVSS